MKHLFTLLSLVLLIGPAQAEESKQSSVPEVKKAVVKSATPPSALQQLKTAEYKNQLSQTARGTTGFFSLSVGHESQPVYYFKYYSTSLSFRYGGYFSEQHGFEAGIKTSIREYLMITLKYNYDFTRDSKWVPGLDMALLVGMSGDYHKLGRNLVAGGEIGPYIKTFISRSHALFLRTGVTYDTSGLNEGGLHLPDFRLYLNLGIQWHF